MLLRPLAVADEEQARQAHDELAREQFEFLLNLRPDEPWTTYVERMHRLSVDVPEGWVPSTFLLAEVDGHLVGRLSVRHELNDYLREIAGHIGYAVRPAFRRRGYAIAILRHGVGVARSLGLDRVLVTCDDDNVASAAVIERCGGVLDAVVTVGSLAKRHYRIATRQLSPPG